jgi:two-component system sensor histidine kinase KdpD
MTRLESGSVHLNLEPCDLQDLIGSVLQQFTHRLKEHPIHLEIPNDLPMVVCDAMLIAQVIANLLDNACKYSPNGSPIQLGVMVRENAAEIYVQDSGNGLPETELENIFIKFYRSPEHKGIMGTGLGLSICKGIIEAHNGQIIARNNADHGLTIVFTLPMDGGGLNEG